MSIYIFSYIFVVIINIKFPKIEKNLLKISRFLKKVLQNLKIFITEFLFLIYN